MSSRIVLYFLTVFISACTIVGYDREADRSFLTDEPCPAPCWYHLELGKSSKEDVLQSLKTLPFVNPNSIKESSTTWMDDDSARSIYFGCIHPSTDYCGEITISNDKMRSIWLPVNYPLTTEMLVDKLGIPNYIDYGDYHFEVGGCVVSINWPEKGISASITNVKKDTLCRNIRENGAFPPGIQMTSIGYDEKERFGSEPHAGWVRIEWPGFSQ